MKLAHLSHEMPLSNKKEQTTDKFNYLDGSEVYDDDRKQASL